MNKKNIIVVTLMLLSPYISALIIGSIFSIETLDMVNSYHIAISRQLSFVVLWISIMISLLSVLILTNSQVNK